MKYSLFHICIAVLICSCNQPAGLTDAERTTKATEARQMLVGYNDDIREHGLLAEFAYLDSSAQFFWVPPGYTSPLSFDTVAKIMRANAAVIKKMDNRWDTLIVNVLSSDIATYTGKLHSTITDTAGKIFNTHLIESGTMIKRKDGWKLLSGQTAAIPN